MRLSLTDRNEFLKAALKTTDKQVADWIVSMVDALDALPEGKSDLACPPYRPLPLMPANGHPMMPVLPGSQTELPGRWPESA